MQLIDSSCCKNSPQVGAANQGTIEFGGKYRKVIRALLVCVGLLGAVPSLEAKPRCTKGSEFQPELCPLVLPKITKIDVTDNGQSSEEAPETKAMCSNFKLSETAVRTYFRRAKSADVMQAHYTLDVSPCFAAGTVLFSNGTKASWTINEFRTAKLYLSDQKMVFLFCPNCLFRPFN